LNFLTSGSVHWSILLAHKAYYVRGRVSAALSLLPQVDASPNFQRV